MKNSFLLLREDITFELNNLERLKKEIDEAFKLPDNIYKTRALGGILHDFYSGIEKIFLKIATRLDNDVPVGSDWHITLLKRMTYSIEKIRPAVINDDLAKSLDEYLRFRHVFRYSYGFELELDKCKVISKKLKKTFIEFKNEMKIFLKFLIEISK